ncbi:MAG: hypothetical protein Ct9H300mP1_04790 [Planctomycetaceae bacterium]|nr:MAG: hypothetical protein Ct9H300mP1_04790 [Planctomycetaceae bacterium]
MHNRTTIQALNQVPGPKFRGTGWIGILYIVGYTISVVTVGGIMAATAGLVHERDADQRRRRHVNDRLGIGHLLYSLAESSGSVSTGFSKN